MYTSYFNLKSKPFQISSDPAFLWLGEKHKEALATLRYGILDNKGFLLLTGDVGTGKTTLIHTLLNSLGHDVISTSIPDPSLHRMDFFNHIAMGFGIDEKFKTKGSFIIRFRLFLSSAYEQKKKVLLIIDESQLLTQEMLEEVRLLSNIEKAEAKLLNIFFVGQNEFNETLSLQQNRAVRQRLTLNYNLEPLTSDETQEYIVHRLKIAGTTDRLFDADAVHEIYLYSQGFPRRINILCDHALLTGFVQDHQVINSSIIHECAKELNIPAPGNIKPAENSSFQHGHKDPLPSIPQDFSLKEAVEQGIVIPSDLVMKNKTENDRKGRSWFSFLWVLVILGIITGGLLYPDFSNHIALNFKKGLHLCIDKIDHLLSERALPLSTIVDDQGSVSGEDKLSEGRVPPPEISPPAVLSGSQENRLKSIHPFSIEPSDVASSEVVPEPLQGSLQDEIVLPVKEIVPLPLEKKVVVKFRSNTNAFTSEGIDALDRFSKSLKAFPGAEIVVKGYTDSGGNAAYNRKLSEFRANIVRSYLLGKGVAQDKISSVGMGSKNPVESNDTAWGRRLNRRVEVEVVEPAVVQPEGL